MTYKKEKFYFDLGILVCLIFGGISIYVKSLIGAVIFYLLAILLLIMREF
jgi:hypothetical protein